MIFSQFWRAVQRESLKYYETRQESRQGGKIRARTGSEKCDRLRWVRKRRKEKLWIKVKIKSEFMNDALTNLSIFNSRKRSGWASDKCLARFDVLPPVVSSFTFIICFVWKLLFLLFSLFINFGCVDRVSSVWSIALFCCQILPGSQQFGKHFGTAAYEIPKWAKLWYRTIWNIIDTGIFQVPVYRASLERSGVILNGARSGFFKRALHHKYNLCQRPVI